jgi:hypothetical protein
MVGAFNSLSLKRIARYLVSTSIAIGTHFAGILVRPWISEVGVLFKKQYKNSKRNEVSII